MAIQISGTTVIDNSRNLTNIVSYGGPGVASKSEAEAGTNNDQLMTPLRVKQAIDAQGGSVINRIQRGTTTVTSPTTNLPWMYPSTNSPSTSTMVPITSVDTGKAFVTQGTRGEARRLKTAGPGAQPMTGFDGDNATARLTSATNITVQSGKGFTGISDSPFGYNEPALSFTSTVDWEVIEFI